MKKIFIYLAVSFLLVAGTAFALDFFNSNEVTLGWNTVTTDVDGDAITGVTYRLYLVNADTDPNKTNPVIAADNITGTEATITLGAKGRYFVGCQSVLGDLVSVINWADEPENMGEMSLFGLRFAVPPHAPKDIRR